MTDGGEASKKPRPAWALERDKEWKGVKERPVDPLTENQNDAYRARRVARSVEKSVAETAEVATAFPIMRDGEVREHALESVRKEKVAGNRIFKSHGERIRRMRSAPERRKMKSEVEPSLSERVRRINILLRVGAYDRNRFAKLPDIVPVRMKKKEGEGVTEDMLEVPKSDLTDWLQSLAAHERQRLYVIGRKKFDFKFREEEFPECIVKDSDSEAVRAYKNTEMERKRIFQEEQKELADALEVVAVPMLKGVFNALGKNVDVYLSGIPDDIAGGVDVIVEFKDEAGRQKTFADGSPLILVVDVTYARMRDKISKDLDRGRICDDAFDILKGGSERIDPALSNARAMKLFRSAVETLGGTMSTQTFGMDGPLEKPREHVARLIVGLDWDNAFSAISNWVAHGEDFENFFRDTWLARRIATSVRKQLSGLKALLSQSGENENTPYISELIAEVGTEPLTRLATDHSLSNIDNLLTTDRGFSARKKRDMGEEELKYVARRKKAWRLRQQFLDAVLAQVAYNKIHGAHIRGDIGAPAKKARDTRRTVSMQTYSSGITLPRVDELNRITESPSERATDLLNEINRAWQKSNRNARGERIVVSQQGKKETVWGDWLAERMDRARSWSDKERAYIRTSLPRIDANTVESKTVIPASKKVPDESLDVSLHPKTKIAAELNNLDDPEIKILLSEIERLERERVIRRVEIARLEKELGVVP